jgi:Protein of unknown function (DUF3108)
MAERLNRSRLTFGPPLGGKRRAAWLALVIGVLLLHTSVVRWVAERAAEFKLMNQMPTRIEVAYVREMALAAPPPVPPQPPKPAPVKKTRAAAPVPAPAASAAVATADKPDAADTELAKASPPPEPPPKSDAASAPAGAASAVAAPASAVPAADPPAAAKADTPAVEAPTAAASAMPEPLAPAAAVEPHGDPTAARAIEVFDWPASTRLSYALTGNYRGEVLGTAQVEWVRSGTRYQVHLDVVVGPSLAPLMSRRSTSDGDITAAGLSPRRYDQDTKIVFRDRRRDTMRFEPDAVVMASGERRERWPGVQDTASQFIQLIFMVTLNPQLLTVGNQFEVPVALPRNIYRINYEVIKQEAVHTPFGDVAAFHIKPRRLDRPSGDLRVEIWMAPQLRYLPARIRFEQDAETYFDLVLDRRPQIAAQ